MLAKVFRDVTVLGLLLCFALTDAHSATNAQLEALGVLNVKAHGAKGDSVTDDTTAIQTALNAAHNQGKVVLFPAGTYIVSDTLKLYDADTSAPWKSFQMIGSTRGSKPVIKLVTNRAKFKRSLGSVTDKDEAKKPCPVIHGCNFDDVNSNGKWDFNDLNGNEIWDSKSEGSEFERGANSFNFQIRGIDFDLTGNSSAVALWLRVAQNCNLQDITINATGAWGGLWSHPGSRCTVGNIQIIGGRVGIHGKTQHSTGLFGITLRNQTDYAAVVNGENRLLVGFSIEKASPPAIYMQDGGFVPAGNDDLGLIDGTIEFTSANGSPAIENPEGNALYMHDVFVRNAAQIVKSGSRAAITGNSSGWTRVTEYVNPDARQGKNLINGVIDSNEYVNAANCAANDVPDNLVSRHVWDVDDFPSPDDIYDRIHTDNDTTCAIITEEGCVADNTDANDKSDCTGPDNRAALQDLIDSDVKTILIPKGKFLVGKNPGGNYGIRLGQSTVLIGVSAQWSELRTVDTWKPTALSALLTTTDDPNATCKVAHVKFGIHNAANDLSHAWFSAWDWKAGKFSMTMQTRSRGVPETAGFRTQARADHLFSGSAGGRHYGVGGAGGQFSNDAAPFVDKKNGISEGGFRRILVSGTSQPLAFYNINMEDGCDNSQMEVLNSSNVIIYGSKNENANPMRFKNSDNCAEINHGVSTDHEVDNCTNTLMALLAQRATDGTDPMIYETGGQTIKWAVGVFKRGTFDWSKVQIIPEENGDASVSNWGGW